MPFTKRATNGRPSPHSSVDQAVEAMRRGEIVIVADDPGRENEGDFVMAAEKVTPEAVNFMVTHGRGIVCLPVTGESAGRLGLRPMVSDCEEAMGSAFTVSIDLREPRNTGTSAFDRAACMSKVTDPNATPKDFCSPGHVFPLVARAGGVLERPGHTEAAVDLARMAGLAPAGVICEILNPDGSMARMDDLERLAELHGLHLITVADLVAYRLRSENLVRREAEARIPTAHGEFTAVAFHSDVDGLDHLALVAGDPRGENVLVRIHSECLTGDLGSLRCDCAAQLEESLRTVAATGRGIVVYLRGHEGRGIGIAEKLRAYALQDQGADTVDANVQLGHSPDARSYDTAAQILRDLGATTIRLLTNNPAKCEALEAHGIPIVERIPLQIAPTVQNFRYLETKRDRMGHTLVLDGPLVELFDPA